MNAAHTPWTSLWSELVPIRHHLEQHIARVQGASPTPPQPPAASTPSTALQQLCRQLKLSEFERSLLLLCVGVELDSTLAILCAEAQGDAQKPYPTFDLALAALPQPHWSALTPEGPLRYWRLLELGAGQTLTSSPLRVDEWVLHNLAGAGCNDDRLLNLVQLISDRSELVPSHQHLVNQITDLWLYSGNSSFPLIQLWGSDTAAKRAIATATCGHLERPLFALSALAIPTQNADLQTFVVLWQREARLNSSVLLIDGDAIELAQSHRQEFLFRLVEQIDSPVILMSRERSQTPHACTSLEVQPPTADEQQALWRQALGPAGTSLNGALEDLTCEFRLSAETIQTICSETMGRMHRLQDQHHSSEQKREQIVDVAVDVAVDVIDESNPAAAHSLQFVQTLKQTCRTYTRPRLDDLAQRIEAIATWNDLVLPEKETAVLQSITAHVQHRFQVYDRWGFRGRSSRGLGISALFAGVSGTGKTMSAEVLAHTLQLDLYRIDLSSVVSKYIGETEKNLRRIFDAAEASTVILLFDEADALFGKRSEVKDSHDRYANMEVSYLLQRMEAYQGLAILTTNLKDSLDTAFLRRIRFVVKFPFPDAEQRAQIWQKIFPAETPTQGLEFHKLARLNVAGGSIRNIALNATFLAAHAGEAVQMHHLKQAAYTEYMKLEKTLTDAEVKGWT